MGEKDSLLIFTNGTQRVLCKVPYEATIVIIDHEENSIYGIRGFKPLEELKRIIESIYP